MKFYMSIKAPTTDTYTFQMIHDDGSYLYFDGVNKVNGHSGRCVCDNTFTIYKIEIDYIEIVIGAQLKLYWSTPTLANQTVPTNVFYYPKYVGNSPYQVTNSCPSGYSISSPSTSCSPSCGDGKRIGTEACDDGNTISGDGCSSDCQNVEAGYKCSGGTSTSKDKCTSCSNDNVGGSDYTTCDLSDYTENSKAAMITCGSLIVICFAINLLEDLLSSASFSQNLFNLINQIQLIILIPMLNTYLSLDVLQYISGISIVLCSFNLKSINNISKMNTISNQFDYKQPDSYLESLNLNSGSSFINLEPTMLVTLCFSILHLFIKFCCYLLRNKRQDNKLKVIINKLFEYLTFEVYVRHITEIYLVLLISSISEIYYTDVFKNKPHSAAFSILVILFIVFVIVFAFILLCRSKNSIILENQQRRYCTKCYKAVKDNKKHRLYFLLFYIRRMVFCIILICLKAAIFPIRIALFCISQFCYLAYVAFVRPNRSVKDQIIDIINEASFFFFVLLLTYFNTKERWTELFSLMYLWGLISCSFTCLIVSLVSLICKCKPGTKIESKKCIQTQNIQSQNELSNNIGENESQKEESKNYQKKNQSELLRDSDVNLNDRNQYHRRFHPS